MARPVLFQLSLLSENVHHNCFQFKTATEAMQSLSQRELWKLGVTMENFMAGVLTRNPFAGKHRRSGNFVRRTSIILMVRR
jgi:hypothetical protein